MNCKLETRGLLIAGLAAALTACGSTAGTSDETDGATGTETGSGTASVPPNESTPTSGVDDTGSDDAGVTTDPPETTSGGGDPEGCCVEHESPGCNEPEVANCVCAQEATCCAFGWSQDCVDMAVGRCAALCEGPGGTTNPTDPTASTDPTGEPGGCAETIEFEMFPSDATHSGAWQLSMSMVGEGEISVVNLDGGAGGSILYEPEIPCDDTWYIWVRYWEDGDADSYYATLDGMPTPEAVFEGDCSGGGGGYDWAQLNWRDEGDPGCTYVEDPWAPTWDAGVHEIEFSYRESLAMGRILITNDAGFVP